MEKTILIFSGMPASGKDTISQKLHELDHRYVYFKKYRAIDGSAESKDTYYNISREEFETKIQAGDFLQYHGRYGKYYGIDQATLMEYFNADLIPIIHIGRIENLEVLKSNLPTFKENFHIDNINTICVQLWEKKEILKARIRERENSEEEAEKRIIAMNEEFSDAIKMMDHNEKPFTIVIKNDDLMTTCETILALVENPCTSQIGYDEYWAYLESIK